MNDIPSMQLDRSDIMALEAHLAKAIHGLVPFSAHSVYFPSSHNAPSEPQWLARERTLLLPLLREGEVLGVFMARGADAKTVRRLLPSLPALAHLCLEHLQCIKQSRTDEVTGLVRMRHLLERMEQDADMVRTRYSGQGDGEDQAPLHKACMGLVVVRCPSLSALALEHGHGLADEVLSALAQTLLEDLPHEVLAARSGEDECTLLLPSATRASCGKLATAVLARLDKVRLTTPLTNRPLLPRCVVGYSLYPQDMESTRLSLPMPEQTRHLLHKARLAAEVAHGRTKLLPINTENSALFRCMSFARILSQGGAVREVLPLGRVQLNLGHHAGAREGQRFSVWTTRSGQAELKGEVVLVEVRDNTSIADTLHLRDAAWGWEVGDSLTLSDDISLAQIHTPPPGFADEATGLLSHSTFLQRLSRESEARSQFTLALVRLTPVCAHTVETDNSAEEMKRLLQLCRHVHSTPPPTPFGGQPESQGGSLLLEGRYGETSLIFLHAGTAGSTLPALYASLTEKAETEGLRVAVGLASYPYLQYRKGDILDCCHKALELALLLPPPQVGVMGSLALNISADQRYSRGDVFGAVEEYKLALLADGRNAMAWNSLGVCMAALSRHGEARRYFLESLKRWKKELSPGQQHSEYAATLYNLGNVCQALDEKRSAARYFRLCVQADSKHYFAHIRLGQLAEQADRRHQARQYYSIAAQLEDQGQGAGGLARRHLARVALRQRKTAEARELLHEALLRNPQDATALSMLGSLCLDSGEDPSMAEMLARKSVGLRPEHAPSWLLLARCLRALGREHDACNAEDRASALQ